MSKPIVPPVQTTALPPPALAILSLSLYDSPRDRELLAALRAANARCIQQRKAPYDLDSHVKHLLEMILGLSVSCESSSFGLTQWPVRLVEAVRSQAPTPKIEKKKLPAHVFSEERGRVLPFTPRLVKMDAGAELE